MNAAPHASIRQVFTGRVAPLGARGAASGIAKRAAPGSVRIEACGLAGDEQADLRVHGGPDKAVHLYAWAHYETWGRELPGFGAWNDEAAFGENLGVQGVAETGVCIGDRWRAGTAELEVTQGRQPCWKLNARFGVPDMALRVQQSLRAGWYCRVLQPGTVAAGDDLHLLHRPHPQWDIARLLALIRDREGGAALLREVLALPLTPSWRKLFQRRLETGQSEDWSRRLTPGAGPPSPGPSPP